MQFMGAFKSLSTSPDPPVLGVVTPTAVGKGGSKPTNVQVCKPREQAQLILSVVALGNTLEAVKH